MNNCFVFKLLNFGYFFREMFNIEDYNVYDDSIFYLGGNYFVLGFENFLIW